MNSGVIVPTSVAVGASTNDCAAPGTGYGTFVAQHHDTSSTEADADATENTHRPRGVKFVILFTCLLLGDFATGYDTSCVETLAPAITDHFNTTAHVGWYGIAYLLASCATVLIYGQLYAFFSMRLVFMATCLVFSIGSVVSATAPSSPIFILGRSLSGLGSAGLFAGSSIIVASTTSLKNRPIYQAVCGGAESIALAFGPVISGTLAHHSSWRVSFYVLIPIGIAMLTAVYFFVKDFELPEATHLSNMDKMRRLDLTGFALYVPMTVCFTLGLQWAGIEFSWDDWRIVLLLVSAAVLLLGFLTTEYRSGDASMFPLNMLQQRSVALSCFFSFCNSAALFILEFFLPIYFQAIRRATTGASGLLTLSTAVPFGIAIFAAGPVTSFIGYYTPVMISGSILMSIAVGLLTTFTRDISLNRVVLYQVLYGIGVGLVFQQPYTAVQAVLPEAKVPTALVTLAFAQESGGIVALSIAQNIFVDQLSHRLSDLVPGLDPRTILHSGTIDIIDKVPSAIREEVLNAYCDVIVHVFYIALGFTCLTMVGAIGIEWRSIKEEQEAKDEDLDEERLIR